MISKSSAVCAVSDAGLAPGLVSQLSSKASHISHGTPLFCSFMIFYEQNSRSEAGKRYETVSSRELACALQESAEVDTPRPARGGGVKQSEVSHCEAMITLMPENICYNYMFIFPHQPLFHVFLFFLPQESKPPRF
jgi:hypothetical protein